MEFDITQMKFIFRSGRSSRRGGSNGEVQLLGGCCEVVLREGVAKLLQGWCVGVLSIDDTVPRVVIYI